MRRTQSDDAAIARGYADRATAVRAERKIDEPARNRRRRAVRRAARHAAGCFHVERCAEMHVLAGQAVAKLVTVRLAGHIGPGREDLLHSGCGLACGFVRAQPVGLAKSGARARDVESVFCCEGKPRERTGARPFHRDMVVAAEGSQRIVRRGPAGHMSLMSSSVRTPRCFRRASAKSYRQCCGTPQSRTPPRRRRHPRVSRLWLRCAIPPSRRHRRP